MTASLALTIGSTLIALGSLVVAAWSVRLVSRSRTQPLRDLLYQRQVDLFVDLMQAGSDLHGDVGLMIDAGGGEPQTKAMAALIATSTRHWPLQARLAAFGPAAVVSAWRRVDDLVLQSIADTHDDAALRQRFADIEGALATLMSSVREHLGTDPLAAETKALLGSGERRSLLRRIMRKK